MRSSHVFTGTWALGLLASCSRLWPRPLRPPGRRCP